MSDDTVAVLKEIAGLLRRRVEQTDEMSRKADERMAAIPKPPPMIDMDAMDARADAADRERREAAGRRHVDEQAFRERLLATLERQNELLARLVERAG